MTVATVWHIECYNLKVEFKEFIGSCYFYLTGNLYIGILINNINPNEIWKKMAFNQGLHYQFNP